LPDWSILLRPELAELAAYVPVEPPGATVRLDANEAPAHPSPVIREVVARAIARTALERYPDARARELKARIAERTGARPDELIVGSGSDEIISLCLAALSRPRSRAVSDPRGASSIPGALPQAVVLAPTPTFVMYRVSARAQGLKIVEVPLDAAWDLDVASMRRAMQMLRPNIVFVASPNNPTGNRMSDDRLAALLESAPDALVVVDEAYADYAGESLRGWRARFPNLGILRTLSKVGLAALRVGWLEVDETLAREIDKVRQPFNVSATSQAAAAAVLAEAWSEIRAHVEAIVGQREHVAQAVGVLPGCEVTPSQANFLWVKTPRPAAAMHQALLSRGILVRSFHAAAGRLADRLRVTIGTPAENDRFIEAFTQAARAE
jgi:histidinol-phosphate aminotransferase